MLWVWVLVTIHADGDITVAPGTNLNIWSSRSACEGALVAETDFGYTAGWDVVESGGGTRLVKELDSQKTVIQCFPIYGSSTGTDN